MITNFKNKRKSNPLKGITIILGGILIFGILLLLVVDSARLYKKKMELNLQTESLKNKIQDIKNKNETLNRDSLKIGDDEYIEKVAREELDLQKPGEKVFSFIMPQVKKIDNDSPKNILKNWLVNFWDWIRPSF